MRTAGGSIRHAHVVPVCGCTKERRVDECEGVGTRSGRFRRGIAPGPVSVADRAFPETPRGDARVARRSAWPHTSSDVGDLVLPAASRLHHVRVRGHDFLDTARILKGTIRLALEPVDVVTAAQAALDTVQPLAAAKNVRLALDAAPGNRTVSGEASRLQQVILNLLANAIKFTLDGGRVDVFVESSNSHLEVRVVDTGQGISSDFLPHVFERFRQAEDATTQRHTGLGLGLGIVGQLVALHGGTVHAVSEGVGRGATFTVRLPTAAGAARAESVCSPSETGVDASTDDPRGANQGPATTSTDLTARRSRASASFATASSSLLLPTMPSAAIGAIADTTLLPGESS